VVINRVQGMARSLILLAVLGVILAGCGGGSTAKPEARTPSSRSAVERSQGPTISDQSISRREPESPFRTVVRGDTLYSIAWESGRDYRELATWNRIPSPYLIKPGQQLRVIPPDKASEAKQKTPASGSDTKSRVSSTASQTTSTTGKTVSGKSDKKTETGSTPRSPTGVAATSPPTSKPAIGAKKNESRSSLASRAGKLDWSWPADGALINRYSEGDTKGLDIAGTRGSAVRAAAGGRVVYQGSGLRGYGQLIIIKHNDEFLSAYAHNDKILIKEGDAVKRGQKIADMGSTGTDRIKLHFEIRRRGTPVDPIKYLPKR
jgi:lipoprotein NlpD